MIHDIIDNRKDRLLIDQIKTILGSTKAARFAVGYFFLSGFTPIADQLENVKELRLLIGNTTNRETLEQIAEGYKRLELVQAAAESEVYRKDATAKRMVAETATNIRSSVEVMDQTDEAEKVVKTLARMIEEKRLFVKVYTKGRLHAKAYIFDYGQSYDLFGNIQPKIEKGVGIVGSSNLTLSGIRHNTELNVMVHGNMNHLELIKWLDELWEEAETFDQSLMLEIQQSWG
jgi:phosphatidylserine/phosphatidylglycerophosphate/cardiolipin synthase-like enzyme